MPTIYMDESGFTGQDLFNADQPVFVLASTDFSDEEARSFLDPIFYGDQGDELKHSRLGRRSRGQQKVTALVAELQTQSDRVTTWFAHKRFVLFQKLVDQWLEPVMHRTGYNFYERGENIAFCNMAYHCIRAFEGEDFLDEVLREYQDFMLRPSDESFNRFWGKLRFMNASSSKRTQEILKYLLIAPQFLDESHVAELGEKPMDIALTLALNTVAHWRNQSDEAIELIHDNSSNMSEDLTIWETLTSPEIEEIMVGHGDHRSMKFPLNVSSTLFDDSKSHAQLQLCDLIAGATASFGKSLITSEGNSEYGDALRKAGIEKFFINGIWPSFDISPTDANPEHGQPDPLDFMGSLIGNSKS